MADGLQAFSLGAAPAQRRNPGRLDAAERGLSIAGGVALTALGARGHGLARWTAFAGAAALLARGAAGRCPMKAALTPSAPERLVARSQGWSSAALASRTVTINAPRAALYAFWRDFSNLPRILENVEAITVIDERRSRWRVKGPAGATLEWEARVTEDDPDRRIGWVSVDADVKNAGWIEFADAPRGRGAIVRAMIAYEPPFGALGKLGAKLLRREPAIQARQDLRRFKQLMETGEIATSDPGPAAPRSKEIAR